MWTTPLTQRRVPRETPPHHRRPESAFHVKHHGCNSPRTTPDPSQESAPQPPRQGARRPRTGQRQSQRPPQDDGLPRQRSNRHCACRGWPRHAPSHGQRLHSARPTGAATTTDHDSIGNIAQPATTAHDPGRQPVSRSSRRPKATAGRGSRDDGRPPQQQQRRRQRRRRWRSTVRWRQRSPTPAVTLAPVAVAGAGCRAGAGGGRDGAVVALVAVAHPAAPRRVAARRVGAGPSGSKGSDGRAAAARRRRATLMRGSGVAAAAARTLRRGPRSQRTACQSGGATGEARRWQSGRRSCGSAAVGSDGTPQRRDGSPWRGGARRLQQTRQPRHATSQAQPRLPGRSARTLTTMAAMVGDGSHGSEMTAAAARQHTPATAAVTQAISQGSGATGKTSRLRPRSDAAMAIVMGSGDGPHSGGGNHAAA